LIKISPAAGAGSGHSAATSGAESLRIGPVARNNIARIVASPRANQTRFHVLTALIASTSTFLS
jgi:hypothetical protein